MSDEPKRKTARPSAHVALEELHTEVKAAVEALEARTRTSVRQATRAKVIERLKKMHPMD
jgi:hypothetical protein